MLIIVLEEDMYRSSGSTGVAGVQTIPLIIVFHI